MDYPLRPGLDIYPRSELSVEFQNYGWLSAKWKSTPLVTTGVRGQNMKISGAKWARSRVYL
jgi:hypothetical protein